MKEAFVFEHQRLRVGDDVGGAGPLTERQFAALCRVASRYKGAFELGHRSIRFTHHVGLVQVGGLSLVILPKLKRAGGAVTDRSWQLLLEHMVETVIRPHPRSPSSANTRHRRSRLIDIVARQYLDEVDRVRSRGLVRGYHDREENRGVLRGRLLVAQNARANAAHAERFYVRHEVYDFDAPFNRVMLTALGLLASLPVSGAVRVQARQQAQFFPDLPRMRAGDLQHPLPRKAQHYRRAIELARALLNSELPTARAGGSPLFALLFDMNALFEDYVAVVMRRAGLRVKTQVRKVFLRQPRRVVKPDLLLPRDPKLVMDTKWKVPKNNKPASADLKQMFVYDHLTDARRVVLLFPETPGCKPWTASFFDGRELGVDFVPLLFDGRPDALKVGQALRDLVDRHRAELAVCAGTESRNCA